RLSWASSSAATNPNSRRRCSLTPRLPRKAGACERANALNISPMMCSHCGRALDAQAVELGACRYCGQSLPDQFQPFHNVSPTYPAGQQAAPAARKPDADTAPSLLTRLDPPTANSTWNTTSNNAPTEFGPFTVAPPDAFAPAVAPARITAPFGVN